MKGAPEPLLGSLQHDVHRNALRAEVKRATGQGALGLLLWGSVARGTASPASDLDVCLLWPEARAFEVVESDGLTIERHHHSVDSALACLERQDFRLYGWAGGRVMNDPQGQLAELCCAARARLAQYTTSAPVRLALRHWLKAVLVKLAATADPERQGFLVATTSWKLMEALCAVNHRPVPASTLMWEMLPELEQPEGWRTALLTGTAAARVAAFQDCAGWLLPRLL